MEIRNSFLVMSLATIAVILAPLPAAGKTPDLFEMSDQFDAIDKQDFQAAIDRANGCTRARNFSCSESELTKAAKAANSGQDKKMLAAARQNIANEKVQIAEEARQRAEGARRVAEAEKRRQAEEDRHQAEEDRARERERQAQREREERNQQEAANQYRQQMMAQTQAQIDQLNRGNQGTSLLLEQQQAINQQIKAAQGSTNSYVPPPRKFTPGVAMGPSSGGESDSTDSGSEKSSDSGSSSSRHSNSGRAGSTKQTHRSKHVHEGINDGGARAATSALAIEQDIIQLKKQAEEWVAVTNRNDSEHANAVITDMRVREGCTAYKQLDNAGGYWARCILDITYEADD